MNSAVTKLRWLTGLVMLLALMTVPSHALAQFAAEEGAEVAAESAATESETAAEGVATEEEGLTEEQAASEASTAAENQASSAATEAEQAAQSQASAGSGSSGSYSAGFGAYGGNRAPRTGLDPNFTTSVWIPIWLSEQGHDFWCFSNSLHPHAKPRCQTADASGHRGGGTPAWAIVLIVLGVLAFIALIGRALA